MTQSAAGFVDFYALLDVDPQADSATVDQALHRAHRRWGARQNSPDPQKRAEAENTVRQLTEAERVLGDAGRREAYDRQRAAHRRAPSPGSTRESAPHGASSEGTADTWITQTRQLIAAGAASAARVSATKAVEADPGNPGAWWVMALSAAMGGNDTQAIAEYSEAAKLAPTNVALRVDEARCYMRLGRFDAAAMLLKFVTEIDPDDETAHVLLVESYLASGRPDLALSVAERRADAHPGDEAAQQNLACALLAAAQGRLTRTGPNTFMPTSQEQIDLASGLLNRAAGLRYTDAPLREEIASWLRFLDRAGTRRYQRPESWFPWICGLLAVWALSSADGWTVDVLAILALVALGYGFYRRRWCPQWQHNARATPAL